MTWAEEKAKNLVESWSNNRFPEDPENDIWDALVEARVREQDRIIAVCDKIIREIQDSEAAYSLGKRWTAEMIKDEVQK